MIFLKCKFVVISLMTYLFAVAVRASIGVCGNIVLRSEIFLKDGLNW
ncbi:MAG: hypothetical protein CM15mP112_06620 [Flavobacteriales bacterium]|nr:MAG: hypothetical protein CM15mP112_06620 [Flavobacteriales bacterium]